MSVVSISTVEQRQEFKLVELSVSSDDSQSLWMQIKRKSFRISMKLLTSALLTALVQFGAVYAEDAAVEMFERKIRPLLIDKCSECHTGTMLSGGLNLESRKTLLRGGESGSPLDLEHPEMSLLLQAVRRIDGLEMPPDNPLNDHEVAALEAWIKLGAPWPVVSQILSQQSQIQREHWAFQPVEKPEVPKLENSNWVRNPIDAFILRKLNEANLQPAPKADRRTLLRRTFYTLTGLPPSPEQVALFTTKDDSHAYENVVNELLASPQYGEHWGRHWLDVARYSDTKGYVYAREERFWVHAWTYRDWVVNALNRDIPYDQFLRLQIAADQVEECEKSDLAAMGFLTLGRRFLGVPREIIDDRIDTLCRGTMGLTVACARCHDHKYDPIPTADYYSLYGVFASSEEELVRLEDAPASESYEAELAKRQTALAEKLRAARKESSDRARSRVLDYLNAQFELDKYPAQGFDQIFSKIDLLPAFVRRWQMWLHQSKRSQEPVFAAWHLFQEISPDQFEEQAATVTQQLIQLPDEQLNPLVRDAFQTPPASFDEVIRRYADLLKRVDADWQALQKNDSSEATPKTELADLAEEQLRQVLYGPRAPSDIPDQPVAHIETYFDSGTLGELWKLQGEIDRWIINSAERVPHALILRDAEVPSDPRILRRGDPVNFGDDVPRQFLQLLSGAEQEPFKKGSGRRELADAITSPQNPLTARVIVNRVWAYHFGQGLVTTPSDFGLRSDPPSHPDLLDWLTSWFINEGWSLKKLHRIILLSNAYQQTSVLPQNSEQFAVAKKLDPENRLLWKMNRHRLIFEEMRDAMLKASGDLDLTVGGKAAKIFSAPFSHRRTLYGLIDRQYLPSTLRFFDFANPDIHIPQRSETTVPQQSLFLLNHPMILDQVRAFTEQSKVAGDPRQSVINMFQNALQRDPDQSEMSAALDFVESAPKSPAEKVRATTKDWHYGFGSYDEEQKQTASFTPLPHFTGNAWQGGAAWPDAKLGWAQLTATGGHPGNDLSHACIRRWGAPRSTTISISSTLVNAATAGDGVRAFVVSSRAGTLHAVKNHLKPEDLNTEQLQVEQGETIDFIVDINKVLNSDQFLWEVVIRETTGEMHWNSKQDFPKNMVNQLDSWQQLAQMLMCTNEFLFVD